MFRRISVPLLLVLASAGASRGAEMSRAQIVDHSALETFLKKHVRDGGMVDYLAVRRPENMAELQAYLDAVGKLDDEALVPDERLALYCNLYNAVMIKAVAQRYRAGWRASENGFGIFKEAVVPLNGKLVSLDYLEHTLIRKKHFADEPRIHASIVCGAVDCPELVPEAYTGAKVREQIEDRMSRWVNSPVHTPISADGTVRPSKLFVSYAADFGGIDKLDAYIRRYHKADLSNRKVEFQTYYEWAPNVTTPRQGERYVYVGSVFAWLRAEPAGPKISKAGLGAILKVVGESTSTDELRVEHPNFKGPDLYISKSAAKAYPPTKDE